MITRIKWRPEEEINSMRLYEMKLITSHTYHYCIAITTYPIISNDCRTCCTLINKLQSLKKVYTFHKKTDKINLDQMVTLHCSFKRSVSLIINNWSELSLLRFHPNKCWLLITIIKHHYQRERWWQSSHGWLHCMTTASGRQRRQTCQAFSHNFSQITISIYLNPLDNQASINKQSSIRSENFSTFPWKFLVCDQPWMK